MSSFLKKNIVGILILAVLVAYGVVQLYIWLDRQNREEMETAARAQRTAVRKQPMAMQEVSPGSPVEVPFFGAGAAMPTPAPGQEPGVERTLIQDFTGKDEPVLPPVKEDILTKLKINLRNELADLPLPVSDKQIREAADVAYRVLGDADPELRGYTLTVRAIDDANGLTTVDEDNREIVISVNLTMWVVVGPHEMVHALMGRVSARNWLPGFIAEFAAEAAETIPPDFEMPFTYDRLNIPILATGKTVNHEEYRIHAFNSPLDGIRYDLLRLAGIKIGKQAHERLAGQLYRLAMSREKEIPLSEVQPLFTAAGLGDCVLFRQTLRPGMYLEVAMRQDNIPMIIVKQITDQGMETGLQNVPMRLIWRKDGKALSVNDVMLSGSSVMMDNAAIPFFRSADQYDITMGTMTFTYRLMKISSAHTDPVTISVPAKSLTK